MSIEDIEKQYKHHLIAAFAKADYVKFQPIFEEIKNLQRSLKKLPEKDKELKSQIAREYGKIRNVCVDSIVILVSIINPKGD